MTIIAAIFVSRRGPYWGRPDVDCWDEERDARLYTGPYPVVAHPPCAAWCKLAGLRQHKYGLLKGEDGGSLLRPNEWVCEVSQAAYGHRARKLTWLLYCGDVPPIPLDWSRPSVQAVVSGSKNQCKHPTNARARVWTAEASRTPPAFADALIALARASEWTAAQHRATAQNPK